MKRFLHDEIYRHEENPCFSGQGTFASSLPRLLRRFEPLEPGDHWMGPGPRFKGSPGIQGSGHGGSPAVSEQHPLVVHVPWATQWAPVDLHFASTSQIRWLCLHMYINK